MADHLPPPTPPAAVQEQPTLPRESVQPAQPPSLQQQQQQQHTSFPSVPARLPPDLAPSHRPATPQTLVQFLTNPGSPWTQVTSSARSPYAYADVVRGWLLPCLVGVFRAVDEAAGGGEAAGWLGRELLVRAEAGRGNGWGLVGLWTVAKYLAPLPSSGTTTIATTPSLNPAEVLQIIHRTAQVLTEEELAVGGAVDGKLREFVTRVMEFGKHHALVDQLLPVFETLLVKYRPRALPGCLTSLHVVFLEACLLTRNLIAGTALADITITDVTSSPLTYMDYLGYHYLAGMIYIGCKAWEKAREMLLAAISMPGPSVSAVQIAAFKKLVLVDLIVSGEVRNYGKIVSGPLTAAFTLHGRAYTDLGSAYRDLDYGKLKKVLEKDVKYYQQDQNYGLLMSVYESIPARRLINLTETYVRMDMQKLAEKISKGSFTELNAQGAEELVVKLVKEGRLHARISHPEGKVAEVSFIEDPELYNTPATIDRIGVEMNSIKQMESMLKGLEQAWSMHEGWLKETLRKEKDKSRNFDGPGGPPGRGEQDAGLRAAVEAAGLGGGNVRGVGANWADAGF